MFPMIIKNQVVIWTLTLTMLQLTAFEAFAMKKLDEQKSINDMQTAETLCLIKAQQYKDKYKVLYCEPVIQTNYKRISWTEVHPERRLAGMATSRYSSWSFGSSSSTVETRSFFATMSSWFASSRSSSVETPIYENVNKRIEMHKDEKVESYGYILWAQEELKKNLSPETELYSTSVDQISFSTYNEALRACADFRTQLLGYDYEGQCKIEKNHDDLFIYKFIGKKSYLN